MCCDAAMATAWTAWDGAYQRSLPRTLAPVDGGSEPVVITREL